MIAKCVATAALLAASTAYADAEVELRVGLERTDNLVRDETNRIEEDIVTAGARVDLSTSTRSYDAELNGNVFYQRYTSGDFDNETRPDLRGQVVAHLVPDALTWTVEDQIGQVVSDPFGPDTLRNRERVNRFSTGPTISLQFGGDKSIDVAARYTTTNFEVSNSDNDSVSTDVGLIKALSPSRQISLHVASESVEYEDSFFSDFDRRRAYVRFSSQVSRGGIGIVVGANEVEYDFIDDVSGPLVELNLTRNLTRTLSLTLGYNQYIADAGNQFERRRPEDFDANTSERLVPIGDTYEVKEASFKLNRTRRQTVIGMGVYYAEDEYTISSAFSSARRGATLQFETPIGGSWRFGIAGFYETRDFDTVDFRDDSFDVVATLERRLTRTLSVEFEYRRADRDSDSEFGTYLENRYAVNLTYRPTFGSATE